MEPINPYAPLEGYGREGRVQIPVLGAVPADDYEPPRPRRVWLPVALFLATCLTTFLTGSLFRATPLEHGRFMFTMEPAQGLLYMCAVMGILLAHEFGHFLQAVRYAVPASLPYFIPIPPMLSPIGTMGAVIFMSGSEADRKQMFDIGITGPLAGLILAVPMTVIGVLQADFVADPKPGGLYFGDPLLIQWLIAWLRPEVPPNGQLIMTPLLHAGWVGLFVTGFNMMPISQMDGGHIAYTLFGKKAHLLARAVLFGGIALFVFAEAHWLLLIIALIMIIGPDHPPTRDDSAPISKFRYVLGLATLLLPIICLSLQPFSFTPP